MWYRISMNTKSLLPILFSTILLCGCNSQKSIDGQVFVSTKGGESIKLGSVAVSVVKEKDFTPLFIKFTNSVSLFLSENKSEIENYIKVIQYMKELKTDEMSDYELRQFRNWSSSTTVKRAENMAKKIDEFNTANIDSICSCPIEYSITTDAEGKFHLSFKGRGGYFLVAHAERRTFDKTESYYWIVKIQNTSNQTILLNNSSMVELELF